MAEWEWQHKEGHIGKGMAIAGAVFVLTAGLSAVAFGADAADAVVEEVIEYSDTEGMYGPDPTKCMGIEGRPDIRVNVGELRNSKGNVRVSLYNHVPEDFLAKGTKIARLDVPADEDGVSVCVSVPKPGIYALAVLHDTNANGRFNLTSDGGGFSRNPKILFSQPSHDEVAFFVGLEGMEQDIEVNYPIAKNSKPKVRRRH